MSARSLANLLIFSVLFLFVFASCMQSYSRGGSFLWMDFSGRSGYGGFRGGGSGFGK